MMISFPNHDIIFILTLSLSLFFSIIAGESQLAVN